MELLYSLLGAAVNFAAIIAGGLIGIIFKKRLPERICSSLTQAMFFCVIAVGITGIFDGQNMLVTILSIAIGAIIGELINIDGMMNRLGSFLQRKLSSKNSGDGESFELGDSAVSSESKFAGAFVMCTLITCVGAMAITGSFQSALGDHTVIYSKSVIDGVTICVLASTLGVGCLLSALPVLIYQGSLTVIFYFTGTLLNDYVIAEISCIGSILIMIIGFNMLGITKVRVANLIPAMFMPLLLCLIL